MNPETTLVQHEARKRDHQLTPEQRWTLIRQAIAWTDAQRPLSRATPAACKANEAKHLQPA
ncbi:MAG TPA: hypothetical protein PKE55_13560 [Kiritimatiellia bacterium]|nr:hypothetical protein [Kiritimatiellia bacterium]